MSRNKKNRKPVRKSRRFKRLLPVVGAIVLSLAVFVWVLPGVMDPESGTSQQTALISGTLRAVDTFHDFGRISMKNGKVSHRFRVKNTSSAPTRIEKIFTS